MSKTGLDHQTANGEALITEIKELRKKVEEMRTLQPQGSDAVKVRRNAYGPYTISSVSANSGGFFSFYIAENVAQDIPTFSDAEISFYADVQDGAHEIGWYLNDFADKWTI